MIKNLRIFNYALGLLNRSRLKNALLVLVFALLVGFYTSVIFLTSSLTFESQQLLKDLPELWLQHLAGGRLVPLNTSLADTLAGNRGVKEIIPRVWGYYYDSPTGAVFTIIGSDSSLNGYGYLTGSHNRLDSTEVWLGQGFLQSHYLQVGDHLSLIGSNGKMISYRIAGAFQSPSDIITHDLIVMHPAAARNLLGLQSNRVTDLALRVSNPVEADNIGVKISRRFPSIRVVRKQDMQRTYRALFGWRGGIFMFGGLIALLAFLIMAWDRATGLSREERRELGILKSIGWSISDVLKLKIFESLAIALGALALGILAAFIHIYYLDAALLKPLFIGWSVLYPGWHLTPALTLSDLSMIILIAIVPYLTVTLIPAWQAAVIDPAEAMQGG